ncbi:MAG: serine/threonine protein kinase [Elusimicrobiales bacterium]|nr:serine/threonine protein kinase [Elusimicrobiales bacterium]
MNGEGQELQGTVFAGCTILGKIGQGGMGTVYKARHDALDKLVCVKLLSQELAKEPRNIEFFLREARSAAKLEHPNIVHVYNFGQENGVYFIIMSYVEGKSLQDLLNEKGPLPVKEASDIVVGVLEGLAHAHSKSVIHRDIKPANILIGLDGIPRIVDFGLARSISEEKQLTMAGEMVGTAYFMSPEQGLAGQVDHRADLYAVGATYFYILTGRYPFDGKTSVEVIHKHISDPVPNIMLVRPDVPLWASRVIDNLMRKKPEERYQTAAEVMEYLNKHKSGELGLEDVSSERTFDLPEVTARLQPPQAAAPAASLERAAPVVSDRSISARQQPAAPQIKTVSGQAAAPAPAAKPALQLGALHNGLKGAMHFALTLGATGLFILAGASGRAPGSLASPLTSNPGAFFLLSGIGAALFVWAIWQKPRKFTGGHAAFVLAAAAAAYAGGAYIPAPEGADAVEKASLAVQIGLGNMFSAANSIVYALFLYLAASKMVYKNNWALKGLAVLAYLGGLALTYSYFRAGAELTPEKAWLAAGGALALLGMLAALTQKEPAVLISPQTLFLGANIAMFAMFTNPQIETITADKVRAEGLKAAQQNQENSYKYRRLLMEMQAEALYDEQGNPIERRPPPAPEEVKPQETSKLRNLARLEYYRALGLRIRGALAESAGIIFIAFFLALMANACFLEEVLAAYRESDIIGGG